MGAAAGESCDSACMSQGMVCAVERLSEVDTADDIKEKVKEVTKGTGECTSVIEHQYAVNPSMYFGICYYVPCGGNSPSGHVTCTGPRTCAAQQPGSQRLCPCK